MVIDRGARGLRVVRLLEDGRPDVAFGTGGTVMHPEPANLADPRGICRANGQVWLADIRHEYGTRNFPVRIVGIGPDGNLVDAPPFGSNGWMEVLLPGLPTYPKVYGFNQSSDGRAFITGIASPSGPPRAFVLVLASSGEPQESTYISLPDRTLQANTAGIGPGGGLWVAGATYGSQPGAFRAYLDADSLQLAHIELFLMPGVRLEPGSGAMVRNDLMLMPAAVSDEIGARKRAVLLVMRAGQPIHALALPMPKPIGGWETGVDVAGMGVAAFPGGRAMVAMSAGPSTPYVPKGWYFSRVILGASPSQDRVDTGFGEAGRATGSLASAHPSCASQVSTQSPTRLASWGGRPTVVGSMFQRCHPDGERRAVIMRLRDGNGIFADGFDGT